jgi:uncharacterized protein involved in outer membrane biogenesis
VLAALAVAAALILPALLDTPAVRAEIQRRLSAAVRGEVAWEELSVRILPTPHGALRKVRVEIPGAASVRTEQVDVRLRFWPLLGGRAEITSVTLSRPEIRITAPAAFGKASEKAPATDLPELYRAVMNPVIHGIREFAPDTVIRIENAELDVRAPGVLPIQLNRLTLQARTGRQGVDLGATAASPYWDRLKLSARVAFADLSATASLDAIDVKPQAWLAQLLAKAPVSVTVPRANFSAQAHTDGRKSVECQLAASAGLVELARAAERVQVRDIAVKGKVVADSNEIAIHLGDTRLGPSRLSGGMLRYSPKSGVIAGHAGYDIELAQGMDYTRRLVPEKTGAMLAWFHPVTGRAQGHVKLAVGHSDWSVGVDILKSDASVQIRDLPGPVRLTSGSVEINPKVVKVDRAALSVLDATAVASATISGFPAQLRIQGAVAEGTVGDKFLAWVWQVAEVPPHLALTTPISVTAPQFAWGPKGALDVQATARFVPGPSVAVDLGWAPGGALHVRRAAMKDQRSDAMIVARIAGPRLEGRFSGSLYGSSIAAILRGIAVHSGSVSGEFRFAFDRDRPREASAEGNLKGDSLDISWLTGQPVKIERIDLAAEGGSLRIREAAVNWAQQRATIRGEVKQGADGPVIDARLDSPGIDLDALLQTKNRAKKPPAGKRERSGLWPLPVTGQFVLRSDFLRRGRYRVAPIAATLALQPGRARLELQKAQLCGISLPLTIEATPGGLIASAKITAQKLQLQQAAHCLTEQHVLITGEFDMRADLASQGKAGELARNLKGTLTADMRDGSIMKFALLGNILSMQNITALLKRGGPRLDDAGFPYYSIAVKGRFEKGRFNVEESAFRSDALGLAAHGWISLTEPQSRLTVLVAPFSRVDELVRSVPLVGYIVGGAFTSVPVGVSGDIRDPLVVPLGPGAVTSELTGIFERT